MHDQNEWERSEAWGQRLSPIWAGTLWGFADSIAFFLVPDLLITASALFSPKKSFAQMMATLIGALLGGALLFTVAGKYPDDAKNFVSEVPFVKLHVLDQAERQLQDQGLWAMCLGSFTGVPYKAYAVAAPRYAPFEAFMAVSVPARLGRLLTSWGIAALLGMLFRPQVEAHPLASLAILAVCWIGFYTYYWSTI